MRHYFFAAWAFYLLFVVYGSLVPLDFHPKPMVEAVMTFRHIRYLDLGIGNRADWVANLLLFIPLSFLSFVTFAPAQRIILRVFVSVLIWAACIGLSVAIEFAQIFFPPRTVSLNDIIAEAVGAFCGILGWWAVGRRVVDWTSRWFDTAQQKESYWYRTVQLYLAILIIYNIMPLDLTISPVEIFHKWKAGRIVFLPFSFRFAGPVQMLYGSATDIAIWIPVSLLLKMAGRNTGVAWIVPLISAIVIEILQLFVYTRVTDVTQIILAAFGGWIGVWLANILGLGELTRKPEDSVRSFSIFTRFRQVLIWCGCFLVWTVILGIVFWYPYDFTLDRVFVAERVKRIISAVPFQAYYYSTEFRALTEVLHKTIFFVPLGATAAMVSLSLLGTRRRLLSALIAALVIGSVAMGIDLGRLLSPEKHVDIADWFLQVSGGMLGYLTSKKVVSSRNSSSEIY